MDRLISEQAILQAIKEPIKKMNCRKSNTELLKNVEQAIKAIPSAEPKWIHVSEKMPEEREWIGTKKFGTTISDEVYVTLETLDGERFCDHVRFQNGKLSVSKRAEIDAISKGARVIAWMPLPKPYEPKVRIRNE